MKTTVRRHTSLILASSIAALLASQYTQAATLYWDSNGTTAGAGATPTGNWGTSTFWSTDDPTGTSTTGAYVNGSDVVFSAGSDAVNPYTVTYSVSQSANSLTFNNAGTTTLSQSANRTLTLAGGITVSSTAGNATIGTSTNTLTVELSGSQTWTNNSSNTLNVRKLSTSSTATGPVTLTLNAASSGLITFSLGIDENATKPLSLVIDSAGAQVNMVASTYTGGTTIKRGTLSSTGNIGLGEVLLGRISGNDNATLILNSASGTFTNNITTQTGSTANTLTISNNGGTNAPILSGLITFDHDVTITAGSGSITLTNAAATAGSGTITVGAGTLNLGNATATGALSTTSAIVNNGTLAFNRTNAVVQGTDFSGAAITGTGGIVQKGTNSLELNAANTYSGATTINNVAGASLVLKNSLAIQNSTLNNANTSASVVFDSTVASNAFTVGGLSGSVNLTLTNNAAAPIALTIGNGNAATYSGVLSGAGAIVKTGAGTQTLSGANTFSGDATINQGTIILGTAGTGSVITAGALVSSPLGIGTVKLGSGTNVAALQTNVANTTTRTLNNAISLDGDLTFSTSAASGRIALDTVGTLTTPNSITLSRTNTLTAGTAVTVDLIGAIGGGSFGLTLVGPGTFHIGSVATPDSTANTYTGLTTITSGNVDVNKAGNVNAIGGDLTINGGTFSLGANGENVANTSTVTINAGGTFAMNGKAETVGNLTVAGGTLSTSTGTMTVAGSGTAAVGSGSGTSTVSSALVLGSGGLLVNPSGTGIVAISGGVTSTAGSTDITITNTGSGTATLLTNSINNTGAIINNGGGTNATTISAALGSAVTNVTQNSGTSSLTLSGTNTNFSGTTTLAVGTLKLGSATALGGNGSTTGTGGALSIAAGTTLDASAVTTLTTVNAQNWNGDFTFGGSFALNTGSGPVSLSASRIITVTASTLTVGGVISGNTFGLTKTGAGALTLTGANTYTGATSVLGGTLTVGASPSGADGALGNSTSDVVLGDTSGSNAVTLQTSVTTGTAIARNLHIQSGNTGIVTVKGLNSSNTATIAGNITLGSNNGDGHGVTLGATSGGITLFSGIIQDPTGMTPSTAGVVSVPSGGGTVALSGANTFSGGILVSGALRLQNNAAAGTGTITVNGGSLTGPGFGGTPNITIANPQIWNASFTPGTAAGAGGYTTTGTISLTTNITLSMENSQYASTGVISDSVFGANNSLTFRNNGVNAQAGWTLSGANTFGGGVLIAGGVTNGSTQNAVVNAGGAGGTALGTGRATLTNTTKSILNISTNQTIESLSSAINHPTFTAGTGGTSGTQTLTFTGGGGTGAAGTVTIAGGVITAINITDYGQNYTSAPTITWSNPGGTGTVTSTFSSSSVALGNRTLTLAGTNAGPATYAGIISGVGGNIIKSGAGTQILTGANTYTGKTTISAGTLQFGKTASLYNNTPASWTATNINVASGATIALNVDATGTNGFTPANLDTVLANISVAASSTSGLQAGAKIGFDTTNAGGSFTQGNAIADSTDVNGGAVGLTKLGTGSLILDKTNNTYTGPTTVSAGTLEVSGSINASSSVAVTGGGTLLLSGSITDRVNAPLSLTDSMLSFANTAGGGLSETIGTLTLSGNSTLDFGTGALGNTFTFAQSASFASGTLSIFNWTGTVGSDSGSLGDDRDRLLFTGTGSGLGASQLAQISFYSGPDTSTPLGSGVQIGFNGGFEIVPIPEPSSTALLGAIGLLGLIGYRERLRLLGQKRKQRIG